MPVYGHAGAVIIGRVLRSGDTLLRVCAECIVEILLARTEYPAELLQGLGAVQLAQGVWGDGKLLRGALCVRGAVAVCEPAYERGVLF